MKILTILVVLANILFARVDYDNSGRFTLKDYGGYTAIEKEGPEQLQSNELLVTPNPFNPTIKIEVKGKCESLKIYNVKGVVVANIKSALYNGFATWNAGNNPAGHYFVTIIVNGKKIVKKITLIK